MYKFRVTTQDKITTNFWLTVVGANSVRPLKGVIPMGFLSCLQAINLYNIHIGQYTNKEDNLLGPTVLNPTPVTHNFSYILQLEINESFIYDDILNKFKISTTPSVIL